AFAVLASLFVSFTLTPMLCAKFLKLEPGEIGHAKSKDGWFFKTSNTLYGKALRWALRHRILMVIGCGLIVLSTGPIMANLGMNLIPRDDQSEFQVNFITPEGYTLDRSDAVITEIENRLAALPGVRHRFTVIG